MIDREHVARMVYDSVGHFLGAQAVTGPDVGVYRALAVAVWSAAIPFTTRWDAHPEFHRRVTA